MGKLYWSQKYSSKNKANKSMKKKKSMGYKVSGIYSTPDKKYFYFMLKKGDINIGKCNV